MKKFTSMLIGISLMILLSGFMSAGTGALWLRYPSVSPDGTKIVFSYQGDLFIVNAEGGKAFPLTRHKARDFRPVWSKDSKKIAFSSNRFGNYDIFVISAEGGKARRLTFNSANDYPSDFTADNRAVIFTSSRLDSEKSTFFPTGTLSELYSVGTEGDKLPVQILTSATEDAKISEDGNRIIYHDNKGYEDPWRKHHKSSVARDIWLYDTKSGKHTKLSDFEGEDRNPVWADGEKTVYYLSERSGTFNIWSLENKKHKQITKFSKHPVRFLSRSREGKLCFGFNGEIYTLKSGDPVKVKINIPVDESSNEIANLAMSRGATEMAVSPSGKEIAFIARGEVFVTSADYATTKRVTDTPEQERSVSFSKDGQKLIFAGERDGSWNIYQATIKRKDEKMFYNSTLIKVEALLKSDVETFQPVLSPNGKEIAYLEERDTIKVLNLATKKTRTIMSKKWNYSYSDGDQWYTWSPDSKWLLFTFNDRFRWSSEVGLIKASGKEKFINLTNSGYEDSMPVFANNGTMMVWFSDRNGYRSHGSWGSHFDVYGMFFTKKAFDRYKLSKEEFELLKEKEKADKKKKKAADSKKKNNKKKKDKKKKSEAKPLNIDFKNLEERIARLTIHSSSIADAELSPDGETLVYLSRFEKGYDLWVTKLRTKKTRLLAKLKSRYGNLTFDKSGKNVFLLSRGTIRKINVKSGKQKPVSFRAEMRLKKDKERAYMFEHIWRQVKKKFYRADLHGVDWDFYKKEYSRFLPYINNNDDFAEMLSEMLGELNASHTGCSHRSRMPNSDSTANFGCFMKHNKKGMLQIAEVIENSPFDTATSKAKKGTLILSIDGVKLSPYQNYYPLMNRKAGKTVLVELQNPSTGAKWFEKVKPLASWTRSRLLYKRWVKTRRLETEKLSGGKVGYVHVRGMNSSSFRVAYSEILGRHNDKEAIIVDTRFNGGGWLHDDLATLLSGKKYMTFAPRGRQIGNEPLGKWFKKSIVLMSESNYSDAHMFPYTYKALGIGKLVGMPVPGTGTAVWWENLQDRSLVFGIPQLGMLGNDGKYLENQQLMPDYLVKNDYESAAKGKDKQLEKAIEVLLKELK